MRYTNNGICELRQTSENNWMAKYQGNYGLYTIKITKNGTETIDYSCSCPSGASPCKHISMIEEAIDEKITAHEKHSGINIEALIKNLSEDELRTFVITQAKYIPELLNKILLEFIPKNKNRKNTTYAEIIQRGFTDLEFDDYYYSHCIPQINILDMWIEKAQDCLDQEQYDDAMLIAKACIEEFAAWLYENDEYKNYLSDTKYHSRPFRILSDAVQKGGEQALFDYCRSEMNKVLKKELMKVNCKTRKNSLMIFL
jgi:hypothetical protein